MGLFDMFKKKPAAPAKPESVAVATEADTLYAPANGRLIAMKNVPDPVFSGEVLGKGCAVWPETDIVYAPVTGTVSVTMGHAVGITTGRRHRGARAHRRRHRQHERRGLHRLRRQG